MSVADPPAHWTQIVGKRRTIRKVGPTGRSSQPNWSFELSGSPGERPIGTKARRTKDEGIDAVRRWDSVRAMSQPEPGNPVSGPETTQPSGTEDRRLWVEDGGERRPFMRGIMIHSLMARGVPFDEANRVANTVRERLRSRGVVDKPAIL